MKPIFLEHKRKDFESSETLISKRQGDEVIYIAFEGDFYKISNHYNYLDLYDEKEIPDSQFNYFLLTALEHLGLYDAFELLKVEFKKDPDQLF